jgi:metal-responsive CopG/Arc/MetJ family transcriptional regulator
MAPKKSEPRKVIVNARVDPAALEKLDELGERDRRSRSEMIDFAVQEYVAKHHSTKPQSPKAK